VRLATRNDLDLPRCALGHALSRARAVPIARVCTQIARLLSPTLTAAGSQIPSSLTGLTHRVCSTSALATVYAPLASLTRAPPPPKRYFVRRPLNLSLEVPMQSGSRRPDEDAGRSEWMEPFGSLIVTVALFCVLSYGLVLAFATALRPPRSTIVAVAFAVALDTAGMPEIWKSSLTRDLSRTVFS